MSALVRCILSGLRSFLRFAENELFKPRREPFGEVQRRLRGEMGDLMAATGAGRDQVGVGWEGVDLFDERCGHGEGEVVLGVERAEGSGHAATAGVEQYRGGVGDLFCEVSHGGGVGEGLAVAVGVDGGAGGGAVERKRVGLAVEEIVHEFLEQEDALGDVFGAVEIEFPVVLFEHGIAGRFQEEDGVGAVTQEVEVGLAEIADDVEPAHAERGASAAGVVLDQDHLESGGFEHAHGGPADVGFMAAHEAVIPEDHAAARAGFPPSRE